MLMHIYVKNSEQDLRKRPHLIQGIPPPPPRKDLATHVEIDYYEFTRMTVTWLFMMKNKAGIYFAVGSYKVGIWAP